MKFANLRLATLATGIAGAMALAPFASATVVGTFTTGAAPGETITVTDTTITWDPNVIPNDPTGNATVVSGNATVGAGDPLLPTTTVADVQQITSSPSNVPLNDFITFGNGTGLADGVDFTLTMLGPGSSNTNCSGLAIGGSCSVFAGSPFTIINEGNSALVVLPLDGTATDDTSAVSNWSGTVHQSFTTAGVSGAQMALALADDFLGTCTSADLTALAGYDPGDPNGSGTCTGTIKTSHGGSFSAALAGVPEPATAFLGVSGLLMALGLYRRRNRKA